MPPTRKHSPSAPAGYVTWDRFVGEKRVAPPRHFALDSTGRPNENALYRAAGEEKSEIVLAVVALLQSRAREREGTGIGS